MKLHAKILTLLFALLALTVSAAANAPLFFEESLFTDLRWRKVTIPIAFSNSLLKPNPAIRPEADVQAAVSRSLQAWEAAANIEFQVTWTDKLSVSPAGNFGDGTSLVTIAQTAENLAIFSSDASEISARTRVFFNRRGIISEADIVLNPYQQFSTDGALGTFDLEATLTHEIGHLLGLEHSIVAGATMNEFQGKSGVYSLANFSPRTLSEDDVAAVRALYGAKTSNGECCGAIEGKLSYSNGKALRNFEVWLEDKETGKVVKGAAVNSEGGFRFAGLAARKYKAFAREENGNFAAEELGEIEVASGKSAPLIKKIANSPKAFDIHYVGFNGQLSKLAVTVNGGKSYQIYLGGRNLNPDELKVGTNSPYIAVANGNYTKYDYGKDLSVFSFEVRIDPETPAGDYSIFLQQKDGKVDYLIGALTVERFLNPWNLHILN